MSEVEARLMERERYGEGPDGDERLLALFLANVKGDGGEPARLKQFQALRRIVARLRREAGGCTFTSLLMILINDAGASGSHR